MVSPFFVELSLFFVKFHSIHFISLPKFFTNLKNKVLDPAIKEINEKTELSISYTVLGTSLDSQRPRVTGLRFFINEKKIEKTLAASNVDLVPKHIVNAVEEAYEAEIIRVFHIFEPSADEAEIKGFVKNMEGLGNRLAIVEACLYAEVEQEKLQKTGKSILSFRGYLIAGLQKGMGQGLWSQKKLEKQQKKVLEDNKKLVALKAEQLENCLAKAKNIREQYQSAVNEIIKQTATDEEKENVAAILRGQSSIYANKTVNDFRHKMYWVTFITMFIRTYPTRFEPAMMIYSAQYEQIMQQVLLLDKSKYNKLVY